VLGRRSSLVGLEHQVRVVTEVVKGTVEVATQIEVLAKQTSQAWEVLRRRRQPEDVRATTVRRVVPFLERRRDLERQEGEEGEETSE
jgi:hypothetical protein